MKELLLTQPWWAWGLVLLAYFFGAMPWTVWFGKLFAGVDIRQHGSGNAGATNAIRTTGWAIGLPAGILDILKGFIVPFFVLHFIDSEGSILLAVLTGWAAVAGHVWSIFLGFRGGKGVATALGAAFALDWRMALGFIVVWSVFTFGTRWVSLGSMAGAVSMPIWAAWMTGFLSPEFYFGFVVALWVLWTHRSNIKKLMSGTEPKFGPARGPDDP